MKTLTLDDIGDLTATPGSKEWAIAVRNKLQVLLRKKEATENNITPFLELIEEHQGYKQLEDDRGHTFVSIDEFINARYPVGLWGAVEKNGLGWKPLGPHGGDRKGEGYMDNQGSYTNLERGDNKPYILARLARDNPDILADYQSGKYRSARQAGIAAGFVKDRKYIQVLPDPEKIATKLKQRLTPDQIKELITLLK